DEFALCSMLGNGFTMGWAFHRREAYYDRFLTLRSATPSEVTEWKAAVELFLRKLAFKYRKPLVLKSPGHTCRVKLLLELFPEARFVHIYRNPYTVFQSACHTFRAISPWWSLQRPDFSHLEERVLRQYRE